MKRLLVSLAAAWAVSSLHAAISVPTLTPITFDSTPPVAEWATVSMSGGGATYGSATVTVNPLPTITLTSTLGEVCYSEVVATLEYSATTGSPNLYSIDFDGTAEGQGFADVTNVNLTGGIIEIIVPATGVADTYHAVLTVNNSTTSCVSAAYNINIIIHPLPDTSEIQTN